MSELVGRKIGASVDGILGPGTAREVALYHEETDIERRGEAVEPYVQKDGDAIRAGLQHDH